MDKTKARIEINGEADRKLAEICKMLDVDASEGVSTAVDFFWKQCKDTLKNFAQSVRTPKREKLAVEHPYFPKKPA